MTHLGFFVALFAIFAIVPHFILSGRGRRAYVAVDTFTTVLGIAALLVLERLAVEVAIRPLFAIALVAKLAIFGAVAAWAARDGECRWGKNRVAILAASIYFLLVPWVLQTPIDGDEPYYLLVTESVVEDLDFDLRNQYSTLESSPTGRPDLKPFLGDPVGPDGEQYSRYEPFLSLLLVPGFLVAKKLGAVLTIAIFGVLFVRSLVAFLDEEEVSVFSSVVTTMLVAFGPPVIFFAVRIWPEVPAAFLLTEALRGVRVRRFGRYAPALLLLSLLKLRFVLVAAPLLIVGMGRGAVRRALLLVAVAGAIPMAIVWLVSGSATNVHRLSDVLPPEPLSYLRGLSGLFVDGHAGLLFAAPALFLVVVMPWSRLSPAVRAGFLSAIPYVVLLLPRPEWHGGWAPPLRYLTVFAPLFAAAIAGAIDRWLRGVVVATAAAFTAIVVVHGIAWPWRLFRIADGENWIGAWLSKTHQSDFSRLFPSLIRPNDAAVAASIALLVLLLVIVLLKRREVRFGKSLPAAFAILLVCGFLVGLTPGRTVHFEDAHVRHEGGMLDPHQWTFARYLFAGGWRMRQGDRVTFIHEGGPATLVCRATVPTLLLVDGTELELPPSEQFVAVSVDLTSSGRHDIACLRGEVILDRVESDE